MKTIEMTFDQRTAEWHEARCGRVTGSAVKKARAFLKTGASSKEREGYKIQLVAERLTGRVQEVAFVNDAMRWGTEQEPAARVSYEIKTGANVREIGFIQCVDHMLGVSPDGLIVGTKKGIEIKCPTTATHVEWMLQEICPSEHMDQIQFLMHIAELDACDFISYDPRLPEHLQLFVVEVKRDEIYINAMMEDVNQFLNEVQTLTKKLNQLERVAA